MKKLEVIKTNKSTIENFVDECSDAFAERRHVIEAMVDALASGEHVLLIGPPGTAKSALVDSFSGALSSTSFQYLMTRYTTPDEIFGPMSVAGLKNDKLKRVTSGRLPEAEFAFLDEIFKANSAVLNSLLTALNERKFDDDGQRKDLPLRLCVGASNELPTTGDGLGALHDRFLFRFFVDYINDPDLAEKVLFDDLPEVKTMIDKKDLERIRQNAKKVKVSDDVRRSLLLIRNKFAEKGIRVSDRRWIKIVKALRVKSARLGYDEVQMSFLDDVVSMAWERPEQIEMIKEIVEEFLPQSYREYLLTKKTVDELAVKLQNALNRAGGGCSDVEEEELSNLGSSSNKTLKRCRGKVRELKIEEVNKKILLKKIAAQMKQAQKLGTIFYAL